MKYIDLTQGRFALIDDDDFDIVSMFTWHYRKVDDILGYACTNYKARYPQMHRLIMRKHLIDNPSMLVDHRDKNGLNNQKLNLRLATPGQNNLNRRIQRNNKSGYTGVCFDTRHKKWKVTFQGRGRGHFVNKEDAIAFRLQIEATEGVF